MWNSDGLGAEPALLLQGFLESSVCQARGIWGDL